MYRVLFGKKDMRSPENWAKT